MCKGYIIHLQTYSERDLLHGNMLHQCHVSAIGCKPYNEQISNIYYSPLGTTQWVGWSVQHTPRWTCPLVMSLRHRKRQNFKWIVMADTTHTWWYNRGLKSDTVKESKKHLSHPSSLQAQNDPRAMNPNFPTPLPCCWNKTSSDPTASFSSWRPEVQLVKPYWSLTFKS